MIVNKYINLDQIRVGWLKTNLFIKQVCKSILIWLKDDHTQPRPTKTLLSLSHVDQSCEKYN